jgi:hypothetical protein
MTSKTNKIWIEIEPATEKSVNHERAEKISRVLRKLGYHHPVWWSETAQSFCLTTDRLPSRQHDVRGHFRRLSSGRRVWIHAHVRGDPSIGIISKEYVLDREAKNAPSFVELEDSGHWFNLDKLSA